MNTSSLGWAYPSHPDPTNSRLAAGMGGVGLIVDILQFANAMTYDTKENSNIIIALAWETAISDNGILGYSSTTTINQVTILNLTNKSIDVSIGQDNRDGEFLGTSIGNGKFTIFDTNYNVTTYDEVWIGLTDWSNIRLESIPLDPQ